MAQFDVEIPVGDRRVAATMAVPEHAQALVVFAHGSGSGRGSPRNRVVAGSLQRSGLATLLLDLLTAEEERFDALTGRLRFDVSLLARRVTSAIEWLTSHPRSSHMRIGCFGASTGAAAALIAAARMPDVVGAVVSRGGRPDLAGAALGEVRAPTLLIVGGRDHAVIDLNQQALHALGAISKELELVPGASHLFEEPGALERVAHLAGDWFQRFLRPEARGSSPGTSGYRSW